MHPLKPAYSKNERDIRRIMIAGTAVGVGCMAASLEALRASASGFTFQVSWRTGLMFVVAALLVLPFWKNAFNKVSGDRIRRGQTGGVLLLPLFGLGAFLYPLRFVPAEVRPELLSGFLLAVGALSILAVMLFRIAKFLEADAAKAKEPSEKFKLPSRR